MRARALVLPLLLPTLLTACPDKQGADRADAAVATSAVVTPAAAADCPADGFKGDKPTPFCLTAAPSGCAVQTADGSHATIACANGSFSLEWTDAVEDSMSAPGGLIPSLENRTKDKTTKILEQGVPNGGKGKFMVYQRADQKGMISSASIMMGKKYLWNCWATIMDSQPAERDKFIHVCRTLKEL
jgi:hypothetical protein